MNNVVMVDGDFAIIYSEAIFCNGFNCYKSTTPGGNDFVKINDRMSFFTSINAAEKWLSEYKESN